MGDFGHSARLTVNLEANTATKSKLQVNHAHHMLTAFVVLKGAFRGPKIYYVCPAGLS
jgi:hypothetical protein